MVKQLITQNISTFWKYWCEHMHVTKECSHLLSCDRHTNIASQG